MAFGNLNRRLNRLPEPYRVFADNHRNDLEEVYSLTRQPRLSVLDQERLHQVLAGLVQHADHYLDQVEHPLTKTIEESVRLFENRFGHVPPSIVSSKKGHRVENACNGTAHLMIELLRCAFPPREARIGNLDIRGAAHHSVALVHWRGKWAVDYRAGTVPANEYGLRLFHSLAGPPGPLKEFAESHGSEHATRPRVYIKKGIFESDQNGALASAHMNIAFAYIKERILDKALEHLKRSLEIREHDPETHLGMADVFLRTGRIQEAEAHLERSRQLNPQNPRPLLALANLRVRRGDYKRAIDLAKRANRIFPSAEANFSIGTSYISLKRYRTALRFLERANRMPGRIPNLPFVLGSALVHLSEFERAIPLLEEAVASQLGHPGLIATLRHAYRATGRHDQADALTGALNALNEKARKANHSPSQK
ncbi:MAG TPA: tetratricopeptide repeat protein [Candidatus Norongarragalinales archaeon]|nr:tetratricopeptide repeat protein [Candidatus Norongarragalinales archaeon]